MVRPCFARGYAGSALRFDLVGMDAVRTVDLNCNEAEAVGSEEVFGGVVGDVNAVFGFGVEVA